MKPRGISLVLAFVALAFTACGRVEHRTTHPETLSLPPGALVANVMEMPVEVEVAGTVRSVSRASLGFRLMGTVKKINAALGQRVEAGDLLAEIDSADLEARLAQAQAALALVRRDAERERDLAAKGASTQEAARSLEDRQVIAEATVREIEASLDFASLRAPFAGRITKRQIEVGDLVSPTIAAIELEGDGPMEVLADVPYTLAASLKAGGALDLRTSTGPVSARIREVSASASSVTRTVAVRIAIPDTNSMTPGSFVPVLVPSPIERSLFVPSTAVEKQGQLETVFVVNNRDLERRLVRTGARRADQIEVLAGLNKAERCLADAAQGLAQTKATP